MTKEELTNKGMTGAKYTAAYVSSFVASGMIAIGLKKGLDKFVFSKYNLGGKSGLVGNILMYAVLISGTIVGGNIVKDYLDKADSEKK